MVWGPEQDTLTAAEEVRLRYVDAIDGIPNETRQPFEDGSTDFERILPGPDRMYPDTDSPPQRITRERVEGLGSALAERPWMREERYGAVGVPREVIHYLIRRGGARLVDLVVAECDADLRRACFFFGERVKGLRREGLAVDGSRIRPGAISFPCAASARSSGKPGAISWSGSSPTRPATSLSMRP